MTCSIRTLALVCALIAPPAFADAGHHQPSYDVSLNLLGRYHAGKFAVGAAEIVAHDPKTQRLFVINAADVTVDVLDIHDPANPYRLASIDASGLGGSANSVAVKHGLVAVAIEANDKQADGVVAFYDAQTFSLLNTITVGALPDMLLFTPEGRKLLVANEGEPNDGYSVDPEGSNSIIDLARGVRRATVATAHFRDFNDQRDALRAKGVRLFGPNASVAQDLEPEYITVSDDGRRAWVSLQEANAFAVVDIRRAQVVDILPLGFKDHSQPGNELDASDRDGGVNIRNWPVYGMYLPDAIDSYRFRGRTYIVSANEGDTRDYGGFSEEVRIGSSSLALDPAAFPDAALLKNNANLGRLKVTRSLGDANGDGLYEKLYAFGARSFSIWSEDGELVYDSGADFERIIAERLPAYFNSNHEEDNSFDGRSDDKGPEPEAVAIGEIRDRTYAFIGLERMGGVMIYDISNPHAVAFVDYVNGRNFGVPVCLDAACSAPNPEAGDLGPESLTFIPAQRSPNKRPLLVVGSEVSGTTAVYEIDVERKRK
jgi:hypothetical protein